MAVNLQDPLGSDVSSVQDVDLRLSLSSGRIALAQSIARRLIAPLGSLFYDPQYGAGVLSGVGESVVDPDNLNARSEDECLKDDRVADATSDLLYDGATSTISGRVSITPVAGEAFDFTFELSDRQVSVVVSEFQATQSAF